MEKNNIKREINQTTWKGFSAVSFCAGGYEALLIPGIGANLIELKYDMKGLSLLRTPDDGEIFKVKPQVYGIPVLFPPNRIEDGTFKAAGNVYNFPINEAARNNHIHGFLHTRPWQVTKTELIGDAAGIELVFSADSSTDFYRYFPHEFECRLLYRLSTGGLEQRISVQNKSGKAMPLGVGFHTAFRVPFHPGGKEENYRLKVSIGQKWELDDRMLPTGKILPLDNGEEAYRSQGVVPVGHVIDRQLYTAKKIKIDDKEFHGAVIEDATEGIRLVYEVDGEYKHWMLWNETGDKGFVCPEPQTWTVNAPNLKLPDEITGLMLLPAGETWQGSCRIFVQEI
mgnify:CR=1 FL=1